MASNFFEMETYTSNSSLTFNDNMEIMLKNLKLLEIIGEGAFGLVRKGILKSEQGSEILVAVKMLRSTVLIKYVYLRLTFIFLHRLPEERRCPWIPPRDRGYEVSWDASECDQPSRALHKRAAPYDGGYWVLQQRQFIGVSQVMWFLFVLIIQIFNNCQDCILSKLIDDMY